MKYIHGDKKYYRPSKSINTINLVVSDIPEDWETRSDDHWTYCFPANASLPIQGWKIHISAVPDNAKKTLDLASSYLLKNNVPFKYVSTLRELMYKDSKNAHRGSSGKFMTIYPKNENQFIFLLNDLHSMLKQLPKGPYILSDKRWFDGNVYFRYGAFEEMYNWDGATKIAVIKTPSGDFIHDHRDPSYQIPFFVEEPRVIQEMTKEQDRKQMVEESHLNKYDIKSVLHFSNGGGVYLADNKHSETQVVLKEGRPSAGLDAKGRDAIQRLNHESAILKRLKGLDSVVEYIDIFQEWEHKFMVEEYVPGKTLNTWLAESYPASINSNNMEYGDMAIPILNQIKKAIQDIHSRGIGMGDLQPSNVIITDTGNIKLIDFESAGSINDATPSGLITLGFTGDAGLTKEQADWFALLRIARLMFIPIGSVQDLAEDILSKHDTWIQKHFGEKVVELIKYFEFECEIRSAKAVDSVLSVPNKYLNKNDVSHISSNLRKGIVQDLSEDINLLPGDIRQYESSGGLLNILTGGFGVVMALKRTGSLPDKAREWAFKYSNEQYLSKLDNGLFTGKSGIAGVLYEIGMTKRSREIFESIPSETDSEDISLRSGLSGIGLALLSASITYNSKSFLENSITIGHKLKSLFERNVAVRPNEFDPIPIGLIDGWSGVSLFFSKLYRYTKDDMWLDLSLQTLEKDINNCSFIGQTGLFQAEDEKKRAIPYLSGGSAGIGLAMIELRHLLGYEKWNNELHGIGMATISKCFYNSGLFHGLAGMISSANAIDIELNLKEDSSYVNKALETINLHILEEKGSYFIPGNYNFKLSGDIFSGSSGVLLVINDIGTSGYSWLPIMNLSEIFPSLKNRRHFEVY
ncbi:class III lanthionine synthetase LanKC [Sporosarcina limicola]|uniref:Serine/threonine protein kinase n=1 Tax=Sporosarcina limicola TaxID=34101 RepID=A0A927R553_9BACL|nr:class III lanthionine synthetase LanKC [Sporosarcina limicola]MBE1556951.1 serine/threonine protein kinase [Sporosarcina limicola]